MNPSPRSAVFYSTNRGDWGWGAPDYVWPHAANQLLDMGIPVTAVLHPDALQRTEVQAILTRGARVFVQPPRVYQQGRLSVIHSWIKQRSSDYRHLDNHIQQLEQPHIFINQGGSYDILREDILHSWMNRAQGTYDLFFRSNRHEPPFPSTVRADAIKSFTQARRCLFNSEWTREITESQILHHLDNAEIFPHLIRFPYETELAWPEPDDAGTFRLASISRLDAHHKGLDVLLQALTLMPTDLPPWTLDLYGSGPDADYLRELVHWLGLGQRVSFHAYTDDIRAIWDKHHLLILTSRYEGLAVSMLEAMACGRPVLRTPYGGSHEWLIPGKTGYICPAPEPSIIATTLIHALRDNEKWPVMGHAAFKRVRAQLPRDPWQLYLEPFTNN